MRQNETVDGLNFIPKHLGMKPSKGSFRWCTNKQNAPKWNRWRVEFQAQAFRNETVKGLIFLCSVLFVRCRFFVCMVEFAVFLECVSLHPRITPPPNWHCMLWNYLFACVPNINRLNFYPLSYKRLNASYPKLYRKNCDVLFWCQVHSVVFECLWKLSLG